MLVNSFGCVYLIHCTIYIYSTRTYSLGAFSIHLCKAVDVVFRVNLSRQLALAAHSDVRSMLPLYCRCCLNQVPSIVRCIKEEEDVISFKRLTINTVCN
jgi:hypothetical protein